GAGADDDRPAGFARAPGQAVPRVAVVLAVAHVMAVARGRDGDRDAGAGTGGRRPAAVRAGQRGLADAGGVRHRAGTVRAGHGGLHGDDLRIAQADPGLAASTGGAGVPAVRAADRAGAAVHADAGDARRPGTGDDAADTGCRVRPACGHGAGVLARARTCGDA